MKTSNYYNGLLLAWALLLVFSADITWAQNELSDFRTEFKNKLIEHRNQMRDKDAHEHTIVPYTPSLMQSISTANQEAWKSTDVKSLSCPPGSVVLSNQDDVDAFGALGCTQVTGNLIIDDTGDSPKITDLRPLTGLTTVTGIFQVTASQLNSLAGLFNLNTVGYLHIIGCNALTDLTGLSGLTQCTGPVVNPCSCAAEQNHIQNNSSLTSLAGLSNLSSVNSGVFFHNNPALQNANGLSGLTHVGGALAFQDNPSLKNVQGLSNLTTVVRDLVFRRCHALKNFNGLQNLSSVGIWVVIDDNDFLKNMEGLSGLTSIGGRLWIINNDGLKNLEGLSNLSSVGQEVWLENNAIIKNLEGLSSLTSAGGIIVFFNPQIKNVDGISGLTSVGNGGLNFWLNPALQDVSAISNITTVGGWLVFQDLPALKNIDAASNITWVGGVAGIASCPQVKNVDGFSNITYAGEDSGAFDMASLENVDGFSNFTWVGGFFFLFDNPALVSCCGIYQLLCANPPACTMSAIGGGYYIDNNGAGCTEAEIIAGGPCLPPSSGLQTPFNTTIAANTDGEGFSVYPNPAKDELVIRSNGLLAGPAQVKITNSLGQIIWQKQLSDVDAALELTVQLNELSTVQPGIYFVTLVNNGRTFTRQLVVQQ